MESAPIFGADFSAEALHRDLSRFFVRGRIDAQGVTEATGRLDAIYHRYLDLYPYGLWAPGLVVIPEMRRVTELLLPVEQVHSALRCLSRHAHAFVSGPAIPLFQGTTSWLDLVPLLAQGVRMLNPARLLSLAACYETFRLELLFSLHLPRQHGGSFGRYPEQVSFIRQWLPRHLSAASRPVNCLDAACGTGEGAYELAMVLGEAGLQRETWRVHGVSRDPLEIFAAAHAYFPHDRVREEELRSKVLPLGNTGSFSNITFGAGDIITIPSENEQYDLILCNGILGGPLLHTREELRTAVGMLVRQLAPGGLLLAADRFHGGWERKVPRKSLQLLLIEHGLGVVEPGEGVGGIKKRQPLQAAAETAVARTV